MEEYTEWGWLAVNKDGTEYIYLKQNQTGVLIGIIQRIELIGIILIMIMVIVDI